MEKIAFISHSTTDLDFANIICQLLERQGIGCWIDSRDIQKGENYSNAIDSAIESSLFLIVIVTKKSAESKHVIREVEFGTKRNKTLLPVMAENFSLEGSLECLLAISQYIEAHTKEAENVAKQIADAILGNAMSINKPKKIAATNLSELIGALKLSDWETRKDYLNNMYGINFFKDINWLSSTLTDGIYNASKSTNPGSVRVLQGVLSSFQYLYSIAKENSLERVLYQLQEIDNKDLRSSWVKYEEERYITAFIKKFPIAQDIIATAQLYRAQLNDLERGFFEGFLRGLFIAYNSFQHQSPLTA